jgi:hypothetical protein
MPLDNPRYRFALDMASEALLGVIVCTKLWDAWDDAQSNAETPFSVNWHKWALDHVQVLAEKSSAQNEAFSAAIDGEPSGGKCPQKWLRDAWDESKREAFSEAIRDAVFECGPVHFAMPSTTEGKDKDKSRYAPSIAEFGKRRVCWQTYREQPNADGTWPEVAYWAPPGHAARADVKGLWVTHNEDGIDVKTGKKVLTVQQALTRPGDTFWYSTNTPELLKAMAG